MTVDKILTMLRRAGRHQEAERLCSRLDKCRCAVRCAWHRRHIRQMAEKRIDRVWNHSGPEAWPASSPHRRLSELDAWHLEKLQVHWEIVLPNQVDPRLLSWLAETNVVAGSRPMTSLRLPFGEWGNLWAVFPPARALDGLGEKGLLTFLPRRGAANGFTLGSNGKSALVVRPATTHGNGWKLL